MRQKRSESGAVRHNIYNIREHLLIIKLMFIFVNILKYKFVFINNVLDLLLPEVDFQNWKLSEVILLWVNIVNRRINNYCERDGRQFSGNEFKNKRLPFTFYIMFIK